MRFSRWLVILGALAAGSALADPNDFQVYKLGCPGGCKDSSTFGGLSGQTNKDSFRVFTRELAAALTSTNLMPPSSLGHAGFSFAAELSLANLSPDVVLNADGTRSCAGGKSSCSFQMPTTSKFSGPLLLPSVHIRKGLPFSFEVGTRLTWINTSRMGAGTLDLKWSVNEGFAVLPDIGIKGSVTRLFNNRDFDLTVAGVDIGIGKRFAIGGMLTLTPYIGWNLLWVSAVSNTVDFQPSRSSQQALASPTAQLDNTGVFDEVTLGANSHNRFYGGLRFIGGVVQLGAEVSYSNLGSFTDAGGTVVQMPSLLSINFMAGLDF